MSLAAQLVAHGVGDYLIQSHWMATHKTSRYLPAAIHAVTYGIPFAVIGATLPALAVIVGSHFVIDRWRLAKQLVWAKNRLGAPPGYNPPWDECKATGFPPETPPFLAVWLMIITDNIVHILINAAAISVFA